MSLLFPRLWFIATIFTGLCGTQRIWCFTYKWKWPLQTHNGGYWLADIMWRTAESEIRVKSVCFCRVLWMYMLLTWKSLPSL